MENVRFKFGDNVRLNKKPFAKGKVLKDGEYYCEVVFECDKENWYEYAKQMVLRTDLVIFNPNN